MIDTQPTAKLESLDQLIANTLPKLISPVPCKEVLRAWFDEANIPRLKTNPGAKRGGGTVFYSVMAVENFFREMTV